MFDESERKFVHKPKKEGEKWYNYPGKFGETF